MKSRVSKFLIRVSPVETGPLVGFFEGNTSKALDSIEIKFTWRQKYYHNRTGGGNPRGQSFEGSPTDSIPQNSCDKRRPGSAHTGTGSSAAQRNPGTH
jgi:hypothetical protein